MKESGTSTHGAIDVGGSFQPGAGARGKTFLRFYDIVPATVHATSKIRQVLLVGRKIRRLRKQRGFTQAELATRIGIQQSDLSRMEKGEYRVSLDTLFKILAEFDISVGEFFAEAVKESLTPREAQLADDFRRLDPADQGEVESFIAFKRQLQPGHDDEDGDT